MNWYKKAQAKDYPSWLANQILILTNDYAKPLGHYEYYIPKIEKWIKEQNPNLKELDFDTAAKNALIYEHNQAKNQSEEIKRNMNVFYSETQNINPNLPNFAVDTRVRPKPIQEKIKTKLNKLIHNLGNFHDKIPLQTILNICKKENVVAIQEDGTLWSGFLFGEKECGSEEAKNQRSRFLLSIKIEDEYIISQNHLHMSWCKMPSNKFEIISYIS